MHEFDREKVIAVALGEVGYREKATNAMLDDPAANAGSGDYTKYARDLYAAGYYNGNKNGHAWCDVFVDWCFYQAYGKDGQRIQYQTGKLGAACKYSARYFKAAGRYDNNPRPGDQVFFQAGGAINHTGLVVAAEGRTITVVEGNAGDRVKKVVYKLPLTRIDGYGHPNYDATPSAPATSAPSVPKAAYSRVLLLQKPYMSGEDVKAIQRGLEARGFSVGKSGIDGVYGPDTAAAVKRMQSMILATGEVDRLTALLLGLDDKWED